MRRIHKALVVGGIVVAAVGQVRPEVPLQVEQVQKLLADDGATNVFFGRSVSVDGDTAVIGTLRGGSAYVFTRTDGVWAQQAKLLPDDGFEASFGNPVSVDGDTVVIGAAGDDIFGSDSGSAYAFTRTDGVWAQQAKLVPDDGARRDLFGRAISVDGDTAVIGAHFDDDNGSESGSAYVFTRTDGVWAQQAKLIPDDGAQRDLFGRAISVDGDTAVIGAHFDDDSGSESGSAYVFTRTEGVWAQQAKLLPDDGAAHDLFGDSVSVDGDTAVIGAARGGDKDSGSAYVFTRSDGAWEQQAKLLPDGGAAEKEFGQSVSLDGDTLGVGAPVDGNVGAGGSAYVFIRRNGVWEQQARLLADDGAEDDFFGIRVSLDGDTIGIGAPVAGDDDGSTYVFTRSAGVWTQRAKLLADDGIVDDRFGLSVSLDGDTVVIGADGDDDNGSDSGSAYVFRLISGPVELLDSLVDQVRSLDLHHGIENGLIAKLDAARRILTDSSEGNDHAAGNALGAFIHQVEAQSRKKISASDADALIEAAEEIIESLDGALSACVAGRAG